jgi:excisionase family DNA binding protein
MNTRVKREAGSRSEAPHAARAVDATVAYASGPLGSHDLAGSIANRQPPDHAMSNEAMSDDVLDVPGAARLLRIGRNSVYDLVGRNEIPHRRLGKQIRFSRAAIMRWFASWSSQDAKEGQ